MTNVDVGRCGHSKTQGIYNASFCQ